MLAARTARTRCKALPDLINFPTAAGFEAVASEAVHEGVYLKSPRCRLRGVKRKS